MKKIISIIVGTLMLVSVSAVAAGAATNSRPQPPVPLPDPVTLPAQDYCGDFDALLTYTHMNEYVIHETTAPDGTITDKITGYAQATVTNKVTGKSVTYTISGPGTVVTYPKDPDTGLNPFSIDAAGPNLLWTTKANSYPGVPTISYTTGHVTVTVDAHGKTTAYHLDGHQTDVCAVLATP
jgi:hypothetical protein